MKSKLLLMLSTFVFTVFLMGLSPVVSAETLKLAGSSTIMPLIQDASQSFRAKSGVDLEVVAGGSAKGVEGALKGEVQIGMVSRDLKDNEKTDLVPVTIGMDGVAIIANIKNSIAGLSKQQISDIYSGKITDWKDVGAEAGPFLLENKSEGTSTKELFEKFFGVEGKVTDEAVEITSNAEALKFVQDDALALGYVSVGSAEAFIKAGGQIKILALDGVAGSVEGVANRTYPLRRPLNLVTKGEPQGVAKQFIDFILSDEGQVFVENREFVKVK